MTTWIDALPEGVLRITLKFAHSSELAQRVGEQPDRVMAVVQRGKKQADGRVLPMVEWIVECQTEQQVRRLLKRAGYPHTKRDVASPAALLTHQLV